MLVPSLSFTLVLLPEKTALLTFFGEKNPKSTVYARESAKELLFRAFNKLQANKSIAYVIVDVDGILVSPVFATGLTRLLPRLRQTLFIVIERRRFSSISDCNFSYLFSTSEHPLFAWGEYLIYELSL
jgi:hypothetical protein